ncbi:MAG: phytoene/squalene synthase family protein [Bacteroidales bacterium]|nr:phytoene/squalene synthase family protein [Bacteroidales bacterium]
MQKDLFHHVSIETSKLITERYSTSFSLATGMFDKETRNAIYSIYGFVRVADEIVDTFHDFDKEYLLSKFEEAYHDAVKHGISSNPVLNAFQYVVKKYDIPDEHVMSFLNSMKTDLVKNNYSNHSETNEYIYGSADVVGLMCLKVFCKGNRELYEQLKLPAMKLGSAFQKVNFLRDLKNDIENLGRKYFPELTENQLDNTIKNQLIADIQKDFEIAFSGIRQLPGRSKLAVLIAYYYYKSLLRKIQHTPARNIINSRIRISNIRKFLLLIKASFDYKLKLI